MNKTTSNIVESFVNQMLEQGWTLSDPDSLQFTILDKETGEVTVAQVDYSEHMIESNGKPTVTKSPESVEELVDSLVKETFFIDEGDIADYAENQGVDISDYDDQNSLLAVVAEIKFEESHVCMMPAA
ncbi:hypothetical protein J8A87_27235 [Vibrio parahaemolyticus]|uniref:Uncharacterized protein n=1 Tax=Vibrio vulnificus TaxID=672 RepID=A0AAN1PVS8_VIBVL|nr:hypothetical protein [Vibrio vulnificus]AXX63022.1 hypothetical protein FORC53_4683 [Vibrio vulnificus]EGR5855706.1 hypothetical protein [Vibrio parahaemolyticus]ELA8201056.1 hypothetical protein [Vibrio parahaemolyticus]MCF9168124.1 hypothetical protein [Vibrio parahaemolyticus]